MAHELINAALAGLLHDVGIFGLRAGDVLPGDWNKETERQHGFRHAYSTQSFAREFVPEAWHDDLSAMSQHHRPQTLADHWVEAADKLSLSKPTTDEDQPTGYLQSVFSRLAGYDQPAFLPLNRLNPTRRESLFPRVAAGGDWNAQVREQYQALWQQFLAECRAQDVGRIHDRQVYLETMLAILQDFTWCIPTTQGAPDVSLFDHLRTTAAIAACLAADERSKEWCQGVVGSDETACLLVGADLSGLQTFIYTLASSGAAKSLRARSFYVQLMSEAVAFAVLEATGLPITNLLYVGGGGFQFLAPESAQDALGAARRELADRLLALHEGALGLTLMWQPVPASGFGDFGQVRDALGRLLNQAKAQPFAAASAERLFAAIGQPMTEGGDPERFCRVTGEDGPTVTNEDDEWKASFVRSLETLGRQLPRSTHIVLARRTPAPAERATDWQQALRVFGIEAQVVRGEPAYALPGHVRAPVRVWRLSPVPDRHEAAWLSPLTKETLVVSYRPFARLTPLRNGEVLTFDELAQPRSGALRRWGVLRMDVDNLGQLFQKGFGKQASLARIASLSYALRLFFEGWLPQLAGPASAGPDANDDLRDYLYLQYSGGDDVFVVGAWDALPEFAWRIRKSLSDYAAGNPNVTLSAGIAMADAGFPLYQAAEQASEAEASAKGFKRRAVNGALVSKDAVAFLGLTQDWQQFADAQSLAYRMAKAVAARQLSRAALQTVQALDGQIRQAERKARIEWLGHKERTGQIYAPPKLLYGRWTWMAAYQLTRLEQAAKEDGKQLANLIQSAFLNPESRNQLRAFGLSARWAQFLTRGG